MKERISVLLADVDDTYRMLLQEALEEKKFNVVASVKDGGVALREVRRQKPQLVLMDIVLPGLDGMGLLEEIMQEESPPKVIVLSAWMGGETVAQAQKLGASYYMGKPCNTDSLIARMRMLAGEERQSFGNAAAERITMETLRALGIAPACNGMALARDMILIAVRRPQALHMLGEEIYTPVLQGADDSVKRVEHALRYVIAEAWRRPEAEEYQRKLFRNVARRKSGRPSNGDFLAVVSDYVRMELQRRCSLSDVN